MPPPTRGRVAYLRMRKDRAVQNFRQSLEKMPSATLEDAYTKAWFDYCRSVCPQTVRKTDPEVYFYDVSTYPCSTLFNNMGSSTEGKNFGKRRILINRFFSNEKFNVTNDLELSLFTEVVTFHKILEQLSSGNHRRPRTFG